MAREKEAKEATSRRGFLWNLWLGLGGLFLLEAVWVVVDFLRPRLSRAEPDSDTIVLAGPVERFEPGSVTAFPQGKFYLARMEDGGFLALSRECTHLGCTVPWLEKERRFVCPCHASAFDVTGDVVSPPAPRPLDLYAIRIENGIVKVDVSRLLKRQSFQVAQVTRP
jgi:cytochrome b6-f complex iron-sulfur subunit